MAPWSIAKFKFVSVAIGGSALLRAVLGVSARAEIFRVLLTGPDGATVKQLADQIAYTRRQVELDLDLLVRSGVVRRAAWSGPATYGLADRAALAHVLGELPLLAPRWTPLLRALTGLVDAVAHSASASLRAPDVELQRRLAPLAGPFERAGLSPPHTPGLDELAAWTQATLSTLADGDPSPLRPPQVRVHPADDHAPPRP